MYTQLAATSCWFSPDIHTAAVTVSLSHRYESGKKKGDYDEESQIRENAKQALERYMHYYQRFAENDKARVQVSLALPVL